MRGRKGPADGEEDGKGGGSLKEELAACVEAPSEPVSFRGNASKRWRRLPLGFLRFRGRRHFLPWASNALVRESIPSEDGRTSDTCHLA